MYQQFTFCCQFIFHFVNISHFIYSVQCQLVDIGLSLLFWPLWLMLLWTFRHRFLCDYIVNSHGAIYTPRSEISGSCGNSLFIWLRNCQAVFQSNFIILYSRQWWWGLVPPHPDQHSLLSILFLIIVPVGMKGRLTVVLIYVSLVADGIRHVFTSLLSICMSSLEKWVSQLKTHF